MILVPIFTVFLYVIFMTNSLSEKGFQASNLLWFGNEPSYFNRVNMIMSSKDELINRI